MNYFTAEQITAYLDWPSLIASLEHIFTNGCEVPVRHHHTMHLDSGHDATMLIMPAWIPGKFAGVKIVNVFPDNQTQGLPTIMGNYLLMDGATGETLAMMDGAELTARRTAGASALAARYLSRSDAERLLIVGSGRIGQYLGHAYAAVRPIKEIRIWSRTPANAQALAEKYRRAGLNARPEHSLKNGTRWADIISSATLSTEPLILGKWVQPGTHTDLIGAFKPEMREADTELVKMARVFVDTRNGALAEAGDLLTPLQEGAISKTHILAELSELTRRSNPGRTSSSEITLFKSVGASQEDLAAAVTCYERYQQRS